MTNVRFFDSDWLEILSGGGYSEDISHIKYLDDETEWSGRITANTSELIAAIAGGNAVVYLGAGASRAAGLKDWKGFLEELALESQKYSPSAAVSIANRIDVGDYLVAAEMLQNVLGTRLQEIVHRNFGGVSVPTPIHRALAAIPFSLAITTNYDCLLESAYHTSIPRLTWQNPHDVLQNLKSGIFCVLKLHGDYAVRKSVVLAKSHYRDLMHVNQSLLNSLRMLLATRTFLFVGVSFSDPDLLALMDEAKALYGDVFGPHYAIFPERYFDPEYSRVLRRSYNIRTLVAKEFEAPCSSYDSTTNGVATLISHLGALSAYDGRTRPFRHGIAQYAEDPEFSSKPVGERLRTSWLLKDLVRRLGVPYGEVCLTKPDQAEHRNVYLTFSFHVNDQGVTYLDPLKTEESLRSLQNRVYFQRKIENDFALVNCVDASATELAQQGYHGVEFVPRYRNAGTALCVPVYADGRRTGVVTIEADREFFFSKHHLATVRHFATQIGAARYEANRLEDSAQALQEFSAQPAEFQSKMRQSRDLDDLSLECLLYQIDPFRGKLSASLRSTEEIRRNDGNAQWEYGFEEGCLASTALCERRTVRITDAGKAVQDCNDTLAAKGVDFFNIQGPIYAFPVHVRGYTAGVFVGWSANANKICRNYGRRERAADTNSSMVQWRKAFWRGMERSRRILHVLANVPRPIGDVIQRNRAKDFVDRITTTLRPIDEGHTWGKRVECADFRRKVIDGLLAALVENECDLQRARLFVTHIGADGRLVRAECVGSCDKDNASPPNHNPINGYQGKQLTGTDAYVEYTLGRAPYDPYARLQDAVTLGGIPDPSKDVFHKADGRPWIVAPVGLQRFRAQDGSRRGMKPFGYLAADNFRWVPDRSIMRDLGEDDPRKVEGGDMFVFQRYCVDFVSDILSILLRYEGKSVFAQDEIR